MYVSHIPIPWGVPWTLKGEGAQFKKKGLHVLRCHVFTENVGEDHFLRGPRLQPALCQLVNSACMPVDFNNYVYHLHHESFNRLSAGGEAAAPFPWVRP